MEVTANTTGPSFLTPSHMQSLDMLLHVQEFSASSVLITGAAGLGKSALLQAAHEQLSIHHQTLFLAATDIAGEQQLISALSSHLGCLPSLAEIEASLAGMVQQQETFHLCIDDAHLLEQDALEILIAKSLSANGWRLILAGDQLLKQRLDEMQVSLQQENLYHLVALELLSEEDCNQLIKHQYHQAGFETLPLSAKQLHQLYLLSAGNAARLVELVDADKQQKQKKSTQFPLTHVAAVVLVGSALLVSSLYQEDPVSQDDAIAQLLNQPVQKQVVSTPVAQPKAPVAPVIQRAEKPLQNQVPQSVVVNTDEQKAKATQKAQQEKQALAKAKQKLLEQAKKKALLEEQQALAEEQKAKRIKAKAQQAVAKSNRHPLLNAQGKQYVLQLLGVRNKASAQEFVDRFSRQLEASDLSIYETKYKGAPWFVVVYGPFDTKQLASQQAGSLSKTMKSAPWVRPLSKIQEDIRKLK